MIKSISIPRITALPKEAAEVPQVLDMMSVPFESVDTVNWPDEYPYRPDVVFRMAWCPEGLVIHYRVSEQSVRAVYAEDNGQVWTDSCCEFFLAPDDTAYYNIETTCIGKMLIGYRRKGYEVIHAGADVLSQVERTASLGSEPFAERVGDNKWSLMLGLPTAVMHQHKIESWDGLKLKVNLYKCGDKLSKPHFVSWQPISLPKPMFHCPEFFTEIELE